MDDLEKDIKNTKEKVESWFKSELKEHWGKICMVSLFVVVLAVGYYDLRDNFKNWLNKSQNQIVQVSPTPININADGKQTSSPAPLYVNVNPTVKETSTATVVPYSNNKVPTVNITDPQPVATLNYNGHKFDYVPYTEEQMKFDPKSWEFNYARKTEMNVNVEVPQPKWAIGIGKSLQGSYAVQGDYRIGNTPFNVWAYASDKDQAIGIKFVQYATNETKKMDSTKTQSTTPLKGGETK